MASISISRARAERAHLPLLWSAAASVAALGAWICFAASAGINWAIWTAAASLGLTVAAKRGGGTLAPEPVALLAVAVILAAGAAVTADGIFQALILGATITLMASALLLAGGTTAERAGLSFIAFAPPLGAIRCVGEAGRRAAEAIEVARGERSMAAARGAAIALPIVGLFALLLAQADPTLALLRDDAARELGRLTFLPRLIFFGGLGVLTLGAYGIALRPEASDASAAPAPAQPARRAGGFRLGDTERIIVLGSVCALFALFLVLQLSYLFGDPGAAAGSGMTYAEFARRGFGELTVVASLATLLVIVLDRLAEPGRGDGLARLLALVLIALVQLLLDSAYRRVTLYEQAYGYTAARLYGQTYMVVVSLALVALGYEVWGGIDVRRLTRRAAVLATGALVALTYWNHEAWIARQNIARWERTGKLDVEYLTQSLSPNAVPAIVAALPRLGATEARQVREELRARYGRGKGLGGTEWYEWNARDRAAREALASSAASGL